MNGGAYPKTTEALAAYDEHAALLDVIETGGALETWQKREKELSAAVTSALRSEMTDPLSKANAHLIRPCYWTSKDWLHELTGLPPAKGFRTALAQPSAQASLFAA